MSFAQCVIGPPGSGKSTYCSGMKQFMEAIGRRCLIVNLDPANENLPYTAGVDVMELITVQDVMDEFHLGPNGALMYCMEYLEKNMDWLQEKLETATSSPSFVTASKPTLPSAMPTSSSATQVPPPYVLFDFPGQAELYTHHKGMKMILHTIQKSWHYRACSVHLVDSHLCSDPAKFISALMMVRLHACPLSARDGTSMRACICTYYMPVCYAWV